jgi:cytochrome c553
MCPMKTCLGRILCLMLLLPAAAFAASTARQELNDALQSKPDYAHGEELFKHCVACHGSDATGALNGSTPRIGGQHFRVITKQLVDFRYGKRWDFRMEQLADRHHLENAQDIADVAAFTSKFDWQGERGIGSGERVEEGAGIYEAQCKSCHGASGEGDDQQSVPRLAGQHEGYLIRQMYDSVDGRRPTLSRAHARRIKPMIYDDVKAVADFLSRVGWDGKASASNQFPVPPPPSK